MAIVSLQKQNKNADNALQVRHHEPKGIGSPYAGGESDVAFPLRWVLSVKGHPPAGEPAVPPFCLGEFHKGSSNYPLGASNEQQL